MKYKFLFLGITFSVQVYCQLFTEKIKLVFAGDIMGQNKRKWSDPYLVDFLLFLFFRK